MSTLFFLSETEIENSPFAFVVVPVLVLFSMTDTLGKPSPVLASVTFPVIFWDCAVAN